MRAVQFDEYGGPEVLQVREVAKPLLADGQALVQVEVAGLNAGELGILKGNFRDGPNERFPCGLGTDFAGTVVAVSPDVETIGRGTEVLGWTDGRAAQAEFVAVPAGQLAPKPSALSWEVAGTLFGSSMAAVASLRAVGCSSEDTIIVAGAAGGVGSSACQLALRRGASVLGLASERNHPWLRALGVRPVTYGDGAAIRVREQCAGKGPIAFIDAFGDGYVDFALSLGVAPERINTLIDFDSARRHAGVQTKGTYSVASAELLSEIADMASAAELLVTIDRLYPLGDVVAAYRHLATRHVRGKLALAIGPQATRGMLTD